MPGSVTVVMLKSTYGYSYGYFVNNYHLMLVK